jgi:hypothetical protein
VCEGGRKDPKDCKDERDGKDGKDEGSLKEAGEGPMETQGDALGSGRARLRL